MTMHHALFQLLALLALAVPPVTQAAVLTFEVELTGSSEVPPAASPGTGSGTVNVDAVLRTMTIDVDFAGLLGPTTAAHIHCCIPPTGNAGVATQLPSFAGFPLGVTSGSFNQVFDMTLASSFSAGFLAAHGSVQNAFDVLLANMLAGQAYFNIHTVAFPGGEIRGTLLRVPEPGTLGLVLAAFAALLAVRRRS